MLLFFDSISVSVPGDNPVLLPCPRLNLSPTEQQLQENTVHGRPSGAGVFQGGWVWPLKCTCASIRVQSSHERPRWCSFLQMAKTQVWMVRGSFCCCRAYGCHLLAVDLSSSCVIKPALELTEVDALAWVWKQPTGKKRLALMLWMTSCGIWGFYGMIWLHVFLNFKAS